MAYFGTLFTKTEEKPFGLIPQTDPKVWESFQRVFERIATLEFEVAKLRAEMDELKKPKAVKPRKPELL